jgi:HEPN domain-containing protein
MNEIIKNWIRKAENDLKVAKDEMQAENPATDMICFHAQQCCEKYLKCFLIFKNKEIKKTHNISELILECENIDD